MLGIIAGFVNLCMYSSFSSNSAFKSGISAVCVSSDFSVPS